MHAKLKQVARMAAIAAAMAMGVGDAFGESALFRVDAGRTNGHHIFGFAGETMVIEVEGDGDTDLDLYVYDENGSLVAWDLDGSDYCFTLVTPLWSGPFTVEVRNLGSVYNVYRLTVDD